MRQEKITLGQTKKEEGNLLTLAYCLSSVNGLAKNSKKFRIHLNEEMKKSRNYSHKFDRTIIETKSLLVDLERKFEGKVEYEV